MNPGARFGRLTVVRFLRRVEGAQWYECRCDCGVTVERQKCHIENPRRPNQTCGCGKGPEPRHGHAVRGKMSAEYRAYGQAKQRCTNPKNPAYRNYGGRGIEFRFTSFEEWIKELGLKPGPAYSVDRINNDGHYEKGNVRWATEKQQQENKRSRKRGPKVSNV